MEFDFYYPKIKIENQNGNLIFSILSREGVKLGGGPIVNGTVSEGFKPLDFQGMIGNLINDHYIEIPLQYLHFNSIGDESK